MIEATIADEIDVGPLDSYFYALLQRHEPQSASKLRTLEQTVTTPIPPLVASIGIDEDTVCSMRRSLLSCAAEPEMASILDMLMITGFAQVASDDYEQLLMQAREADKAGVPVPT